MTVSVSSRNHVRPAPEISHDCFSSGLIEEPLGIIGLPKRDCQHKVTFIAVMVIDRVAKSAV